MKQKWIFLIFGSICITACSAKVDESKNEDINAESPASLPANSENYWSHEGDVYYYRAKINTKESEEGVASPPVVGLVYLGKDYNNKFVFSLAKSRSLKIKCSDPCEVIHFPDGRDVAFTKQSVIGMAFEDAMHGRLVSAKDGVRTSSSKSD